ncbi:hypothetical protein OPV22_023826 [Ensete ventricosum]|uniref:Serine/threonine-protein kinase 11-interacting protein n=1 Tax=Ensete ventricosum TaxID=4639 RepID=A0AAV8QXM0_ENSVE|nr:hypothetical protein OPV22_023826 [Ensete ventricosum]
MAIVTGDRYLEHLVQFVERNAGPLLEGALTLKLNPVGLHYVHTRLEALQELEGLLAGAPVDYLRAYVSDLGDHRALEQLRRILELLTALKVVTVLPPPGRDPTPLSLLPFGRLKVLELRGCDLSTTAAKGLLDLRHTLEKLVCHNSTDALRHVFASRIADIKDSPAWNKLRFVSCTCNDLVLMDESLQLLPVVETLDLSRNRFAKLDNIRKCTKLRYLDLGFNHLRTISPLSEVSCRIVKLVLRNNALTSLRGIENLKSLEGLDLSYNIISSFTDLEILTSLPSLHNLWLEGNPICCSRWYRAHVFSFFSNLEKLKLDEKVISTREYWERHVIFARRQKKPAGYGFYFPAKDASEDESHISMKKKKHSRLASIEEEEQRRIICSDQESLSCDSDSLRKEEIISDTDTRVADSNNRAKYMKNDQSVLWLREFQESFDQTPDEAEVKSHSTEFSLVPHNMRQRKSHKPSEISSTHVANPTVISSGGTSSRILESDKSFKDAYPYIGDHRSNGIEKMECSVVNSGNVTLIETNLGLNSEQDILKYNLTEPQGVSPLELKLHSSPSHSTVEGHQVEGITKLGSLTAIDDIIGSQSSMYPRSPPHYREDILHRRLYLEEEFLQQSADSLSVRSSDSDTSCSDVASCELNSSNSDLDGLLIQTSANQGFSGYSLASLNLEHHAERKHDKASVRENSIMISDNSTEQESDIDILKNGDKPSSTHGISVNGCYGFAHGTSQEVGGIEKQRGRGKLKRRFITLSEDLHEKPIYEKLNGVLEFTKTDGYGQWNITSEEPSVKAEQSCCNNHSSIVGGCNSCAKAGTSSLDLAQYEHIMDFFHRKVAGFGASETFEEVVRCDCVFQCGTVFQESEVAVLRSCEDKLYILLTEATPDGRDIVSEVLGCHKFEDLREVVVGLGLQALRIYLEGSTTYLFFTRISEKSKSLLSLLRLCDSTALTRACSLTSWEQVQVKLLEKCLCKDLKIGIFFYSMLLFWHDDSEGQSWFTRSIFVVEGHMVVCIENLVQFGSSIDDCGLTCPYYSLDSCCAIQDILEMVIELGDSRCLTLTFADFMSGVDCFADNAEKEKPSVETSKVRIWKLKWYSEETLFKFVALLKAIRAGLTASPLPLKGIS